MRTERGIALLETLVAIVILATAGIAFLELVGAGLRGERESRSREATLVTEERLLAAFTLLREQELAQRIGRREIGEFVVEVQRPEKTLYRIAVARMESPQVEDLVTVVYRAGAP